MGIDDIRDGTLVDLVTSMLLLYGPRQIGKVGISRSIVHLLERVLVGIQIGHYEIVNCPEVL